MIDTPAVLEALKDGRIGALALDVYEEEGDLFFRDLSNDILSDDVFARLLTFPNVLITGHQAFFTHEALTNIAETTLGNVTSFEKTGAAEHTVSGGECGLRNPIPKDAGCRAEMRPACAVASAKRCAKPTKKAAMARNG